MYKVLRMRTNTRLDDDLLSQAAKYSAASSKWAVVHEPLSAYVAAKAEKESRLTYRERLVKVRARTAVLRVRSDIRSILRADRNTLSNSSETGK